MIRIAERIVCYKHILPILVGLRTCPILWKNGEISAHHTCQHCNVGYTSLHFVVDKGIENTSQFKF